MATFAVTTQKGPHWERQREIREQAEWESHAAFVDELVEQRVIILGGPVSGDDNEVALLAVEATGESEVRSIFGRDPWARNGVFRIGDVRPWLWWLDGRNIPLR